MREELGLHVWEFDALSIARMLSPRTRSGLNSTQRLADYVYTIDQPVIQRLLSQQPLPQYPALLPAEHESHKPLATFLDSIIAACEVVYANATTPLHLRPQDERWWQTMRVMLYDREMGHSIQGAAAVKPHLLGLRMRYQEILPCCCTPANDTYARRDAQMEVKTAWLELLLQARTYTKASLSDNPLCSVLPVIGINHAARTFIMFLFHAGGVSVSEDLSMDNNVLEIMRILMSILLWQSPMDAGMPAFTDGDRVALQRPGGGAPTNARVESLLHQSLGVRSRRTMVALLHGVFIGLPVFLCMWLLTVYHPSGSCGGHAGWYLGGRERKRREFLSATNSMRPPRFSM